MKYADTHEFTSQTELATPAGQDRVGLLETLKSTMKALVRPRFDPTRLNATERREMGVMECELDWYQAKHGPLVK